VGGWESVWEWVSLFVGVRPVRICVDVSLIYVFCVCVYVFCVCVHQGAQRFFSIEQQLRLEIDSFGNPL